MNQLYQLHINLFSNKSQSILLSINNINYSSISIYNMLFYGLNAYFVEYFLQMELSDFS